MESWQRLGDSPFSRVNHQAVCLGECIYVFGGFDSQMQDVDYNKSQIDTYMWDIRKNEWRQLPYPLLFKSWDCTRKTWGPDPILERNGCIQPSFRFGHTVVAWRGRGWLFGGRMKHQVCPNQLYMFDPGSLSHYQSTESLNGQQLGCKFSTRKLRPACWAEVRGMVGSIPTPRDGHSATVSENAMFIFGGYDSVFDNYDNSVYRLDFITWNWTQIEIREEITPSLSYFPTECPNMNIDNGVNFTDENRISTNQTSSSPCSQIPLPRDFACLASYQGRIFLFGGRSKSPDQAAAYDVYDSAVWELIPLVYTSATSSSNSVNILSEKERLIPARCTACDEEMIDCLGTTRSRLFRILWEEETGNWFGPEFWATCPPRPCCLWKFLNSKAKRKSKNRRHNYKLPTQYRSRWSSGSAVWVVRHSGHGLQTPEVLIPELLNKINASSSSSTAATLDDAQLPFLQPSFKLNSPYGRRSPSHWLYNGNLYIAFGAIRSQTGQGVQLHYQDVWRFNLFTYIWTQVCTSSSSSSSFQIHLPSARRRAIACLHIAAPNISSNNDDGDNNNNNNNNSLSMKQKPRVYVFGGTQPRVLNKKINNYSQSLHHMSTTTTNSTSTSASFYNSLPHRRSLNINWRNNRTQNEILGLHKCIAFTAVLCIQSNSSDNGNGMKCGGGGGGDGSGGSTPNNASSSSNTTITKFHLIIIMPRDNPPIRDNFFVLSNLFIINYDELSVVFNDSSTTSTTTSNTSNVSHSSFIRHLLTSAFQNSLSIDDDINSLRDNRSAEKVFFIFKLAWLTLCTRRDSSVCRTRCHGDDDKTDNTEASSSSSASASSSQFHIYFILSDVLVGEEILLDGTIYEVEEPYILEEYIFSQNSPMVIKQYGNRLTVSPSVSAYLKPIIYILLEAIERTLHHTSCLKYAPSSNYSLTNNNNNVNNNNKRFNLLTYKTNFTYSDDPHASEAIESSTATTRVYIDVLQLMNRIVTCNNNNNNNNNNNRTNETDDSNLLLLSSSLMNTANITSPSFSNATAIASSSSLSVSSSPPSRCCCKYHTLKSIILSQTNDVNLQGTVASILIEYINSIQNILPSLLLDGSRTISYHHQQGTSHLSCTNSVDDNRRHSSSINMIDRNSGRLIESSSSTNTPRVLELVQYICTERQRLNENQLSLIRNRMLSSENLFTLNHFRILNTENPFDTDSDTDDDDEEEEEEELGEEEDYDDDDVDMDVEFEDDSEQLTDSKDTEIHLIPNIGVISKGIEELQELSDCYVFSFDTSLYDLCLRNTSDSTQESLLAQVLPSDIVSDLKHLYSPNINTMRRSKFG